MSIAKIVELTSESPNGYDDAVKMGIDRARKTLDGVKGVWIKDHEIHIADDGRMSHRVTMKVTFVMHD